MSSWQTASNRPASHPLAPSSASDVKRLMIKSVFFSSSTTSDARDASAKVRRWCRSDWTFGIKPDTICDHAYAVSRVAAAPTYPVKRVIVDAGAVDEDLVKVLLARPRQNLLALALEPGAALGERLDEVELVDEDVDDGTGAGRDGAVVVRRRLRLVARRVLPERGEAVLELVHVLRAELRRLDVKDEDERLDVGEDARPAGREVRVHEALLPAAVEQRHLHLAEEPNVRLVHVDRRPEHPRLPRDLVAEDDRPHRRLARPRPPHQDDLACELERLYRARPAAWVCLAVDSPAHDAPCVSSTLRCANG